MTRTLVALVMLAFGMWPATLRSESGATEMPPFYLCAEFVAEASAVQAVLEPEKWLVNVKLTAAGTSALADFTRTYLGRTAQVLVGSLLVVKTRVQTVVRSGLIQSSAQSEASAVALTRLLKSAPAAPCGGR